MNDNYGQWAMVAFDVALVGWGARGLFHPRSRSDWGVVGGMWAFLVALYAEMYGFPLTVYLLEGPLGKEFPQLRPTFAGGHIWNDLIGWKGTPQLSPFHLASYLFILGGFWLTGAGWAALWRASRADTLATDGAYARLRHPQYVGFTLIMAGFLLQWPTIPTMAMFPALLLAYRRLARREEHEQAARFGPAWDAYAAAVPRWWPKLRPVPIPVAVMVGWARMSRRRRPDNRTDTGGSGTSDRQRSLTGPSARRRQDDPGDDGPHSTDRGDRTGQDRHAQLFSQTQQRLADHGVGAQRGQEQPAAAGPDLDHRRQGPSPDGGGESGLQQLGGNPPEPQAAVRGPQRPA